MISATQGGLKESPELELDSSAVFAPSEAGEASYDNVEEEFDSSDIADVGNSLRASVTVAVCQAIKESTVDEDLEEVGERIKALLLHTAMLQTCNLSERTCPEPKAPENNKEREDRGFIQEFSEVTWQMIEEEHDLFDEDDLKWDIYDLIDGRIFLNFIEKLRKGEEFPEKVVEIATVLIKAALGAEVVEIPATSETEETPVSEPLRRPAVMAFSHPVVDEFLKDIKLEEAPEQRNSKADLVFEDLTHWHNSNRSLVTEKKPTKLPTFILKRNQKMESDMVAYSASLTNSRGKVIDPETIVVAPKRPGAAAKGAKGKPNGQANGQANGKPNGKEAKAGGGGKKGGKKGQQNKVSGKAAALEAAKKVQQGKAENRTKTIIQHWNDMCEAFENDESLVSRYLKADKFAYDKSGKDDAAALGSEVELYMCNILGKIWKESRVSFADYPKGKYLMAMIWNWLQQSTKRPVTPSVAAHITKLMTLVEMPEFPVTWGNQTQDLAFKFDFKAFLPVKDIIDDYRALQLQHGGPYMDRRFDSQPDERVRFEPDAWQREVLDSIDNDNSLLAVAPTSAGKTFISFYAMKKVLEESDEGVLVYVAPTKALVNQIAAEINANFSKKFESQGAKSVWAIHTRDYRVHNPTGCQILVTVPHVLQIMLLSPANANGGNAWSKRVKRIIFDEVHSIGQSEDGVIWEQLLLQAPCPIVALSATVGNPEEFRDWLALSQAKKGYKMDMVVHSVRYSELRKFIYEPSDEQTSFKGLKKALRLPVPGLDEGNTQCENIQFLHPVVALTERNRSALDDVSFEARDCFTLWDRMTKTLPENVMKKLNVRSPSEALPKIMAKSDVIKWEKELKEALRKGIEEGLFNFQGLRDYFDTSASSSSGSPKSKALKKSQAVSEVKVHSDTLFSLACDLHSQDALPALVFNYDRADCEEAAQKVLGELVEREKVYKEKDAGWKETLRQFEEWQNTKERQKNTNKGGAVINKRSKDEQGDSQRVNKMDVLIAGLNIEVSKWESFDPLAPLENYSFADHSKLMTSEFEEIIGKLKWEKLAPWMTEALHRGIGVHHSGMNRRYRQVVEILFRRGFLRLVVATGTLAMGINMPCKTVVFSGDSIFLTAQNYRQASGRAGRRGFDLLGNVVFNGIPRERVYEVMSSRLPDLRGQFPISTTLVLRLFGLLHGTKNSQYAQDTVKSLLSQTHLYLGGPESASSIMHHVRFSIEYLRRQYLLSEKGVPLNFSGLVGHLYFTENSVFAFHSLLKGGYFHKLCQGIDKNPDKVMYEMMLVLSHLFNRIPTKKTEAFAEAMQRSISMVFLPELPKSAETLLLEHNAETLSIFKNYVHSYINSNLENQPDDTLPFTKTAVDSDKTSLGNVLPGSKTTIRSPFVALSGFTDEFTSIHDLCANVRGGVFLEESAIPYIPIWPHESSTELNAYLLDFWKVGSLKVLVDENQIKPGDVWFLLKDFSLTLASIVASLQNVLGAENMEDSDMVDVQEVGENAAESAQLQRELTMEKSKQVMAAKQKKQKAKLKDDWNEDAGDDEEEEEEQSKPNTVQPTPAGSDYGADTPIGKKPAWQQDGGGLLKVLQAFMRLREEFDTKFKKTWA